MNRWDHPEKRDISVTEQRIPLEISLPVSLVNHLERLEEQLEIKSKSFVIQMLLQEVFADQEAEEA